MVGSVVRVTGSAHTEAERIGWSVILKFVMSPSSGAGKFVPASAEPTSAWYWRREQLLYESTLLQDLPVGFTAPKCYRIDDQPDGYWLWFEDVVDHDHRRWPLEYYAIAARHIGRFSGQFAAPGMIPAYAWLTPRGRRMREAEKDLVNGDIWSKLPELRRKYPIMRRGWPDGVLEDYHRIWIEREQFFQALDRLPVTLKHGDTGNRNLFLRSRDGQSETVAIDWAFTGIGAVGEDLVPLVHSSILWFGVQPSEFGELDRLAFEGYLQGLADAGWHGDPKAVRLAYLALTTLRFGLILMDKPEPWALDEAGQMKLEQLMGRPLEEIVDNTVAVRRIVVACADEARSLLAA